MLVILLGVTILSMILFVKCSFLYFSKSWLGEKILNSPMFYWPSLKIKQNERNLSPYLRTEVNCGRSTVFMERSDRWFCRLERAGFRQNHDRDVCSIFSRSDHIPKKYAEGAQWHSWSISIYWELLQEKLIENYGKAASEQSKCLKEDLSEAFAIQCESGFIECSSETLDKKYDKILK